ncbi:MAG: hypothetical protein JRH15_17655 [Deltaproteobacteria bacterium]|nr:hypothetical protein [Deltaproteobacteria bacterium]
MIDEDGCVPAIGGAGGVGCLPMRNPMGNDPNCGRATIDNCPTRLNDLLAIYGLGVSAGINPEPYRTDPWGNLYQWGDGTILTPDNRRYHLFYSMGPNGLPGDDDDVTPY